MEIRKTKDYSIFKKIEGNRELNAFLVESLAASIMNCNLINARPVIVNEKMEVIDGQHRIAAAKLLNEEVFYIIIPGMDYNQMATLNSVQKTWQVSDYYYMYYKQGLKEYVKLKNFAEKNNINETVILRFFQEKHGSLRGFYEAFKSGKFVFNFDIEKLSVFVDEFKKTVSTIIKCKFSSEKKESWMKTKSFFCGFLDFCMKTEETINWELFFNHLKANLDKISMRATKEQYSELFLNIYNWKMRKQSLEK